MSQQFHHEQLPEDDAQVPLGAGADSAPAEDYVESKPRMNSSTVGLIGAFAAALVVLYLLGLQNKPRPAAAGTGESDINARIDALLGSQNERDKMGNFFDATARLVARLQDRFDDRKTSFDLAGNPFEQNVPTPVVSGGHTVVLPREPPVNLVRAALLRQVAADFDALRLDGIMLGSNPIALINKRTIRVGDSLGHLTVKEIKEGQILLCFEDQVFSLQENKNK